MRHKTIGTIVCFLLFVLFPMIGKSTIKPLPKINKEFLVVVHVVLDQAGGMGVDTNAIKATFTAMNAIFKPIEASFMVCEVRLIKNFQYNDTLSDPYWKEVFAEYHVANRINVFYINTFKSVACGKADLGGVTPAMGSGIFISKKVSCLALNVLAHEIGHYFSLEHPFETSHGMELVNGSNCATAGDGLCDTPADPYINPDDPKDYVTNSCLFYNTKKDANGEFYDPDVSNIMSYYGNCVCLTFSYQQYEKMANYYLSNPLKW